jgi:hypothetical protein
MKNISNNTAKKKALIFALIVLAIITRAYAQDYAFKVLATNGNVNLKTSNKKIWSGSTLSPTDEVVVGANSYVGLMHKGGKTLEIKQAGSYKISDLNSKVGAANSSTSAKYASYVAGEMAKADRQDINKNHRKYMAITGSVERANPNTAFAYFAYPKDQHANPTMDVLNSIVTVRLYGSPLQEGIAKNKNFGIRILDFYGKVIYTQDIKADDKGEGLVQLDFSKMQYKGEPSFILEVTVKEAKEPSKERSVYNINLVSSDSKFQEVKKDAAEYSAEPSALNKMLEARIYEEAQLFLDAATCYEAAIAMEPNVDTYKIAYQDFIARNRMKLMARKDQSGKLELAPITINTNVKDEESYKDGANTPVEEPKTEEKPKKEKGTKKIK